MNTSITNFIELADRQELNAHDNAEQTLRDAFHAMLKDETHLHKAEVAAVQFGIKHLRHISDAYKEELVRWFNRRTGPWLNNLIYCLFFHNSQWFGKLAVDDEMVFNFAGPWVRPMLNLADNGVVVGHVGLADMIQAFEDEKRLEIFKKINDIRMENLYPIHSITSAFNALTDNERFHAIGILEEANVSKEISSLSTEMFTLHY